MSTTLERIKASSADLTSTDANKRAKALEIKRRYQEGLFNAELEAEGAKPVPIKQPRFDFSKVDMAKAMDVPQKDGLMSRAPNETATDIKETGTALMDTAKNTMQGVKDIATDQDYNLIQKGTGILGKLAGGVSGAIGDVATGAGKALLSQEAENSLKQIATGIAQGVAETDTAKALVDWYGSLDKDNKLIVDSLGGMAAFMADVFTAGVAGTVAKPLVKGTVDVLEATTDALKTGVKEGGNKISDIRRASSEQTVNDAVGRIIQGNPDDIEMARKALSEIDTEGVKDYAELNTRIDDQIAFLSEQVDKQLKTDPTTYSKYRLARESEVKGIDGKKTKVYDNQVITALDQLQEYYSKTNDLEKATQIKQYKAKLDASGLTIQEVNNIARMHGKDLNAYNANGELASGLTKQAAENTRQGLKDTVRQYDKTGASAELDPRISDLIKTRSLTTDVEEKAGKLYQRVKNRSLGAKVGGFVADVADFISLGTARGFVSKLIPSNVGNKTANYLDIQKELEGNLKTLDKLLNIKDEKKLGDALVSWMDEIQPGLSTQVKSGLSESQKDDLLKRAFSLKSNDMLKRRSGLADTELDLDLVERLDTLISKADKTSLTEREYAELNALLQEIE